MTDITLRSDMTVELIDSMGGDASITRAARVSTGADLAPGNDTGRTKGLISYLMRERHGVPFESVLFTFRIECPIFVARQIVKTRISSLNETSARYRELKPEFWVPRPDRPLANVGTSARPKMAAHRHQEVEHKLLVGDLRQSYVVAWDVYQRAIHEDIANEVARAVLPVATYTSLYFTLNLRSLFNFLAVRVESTDAKVPSHPQAEIAEVAEQMEAFVAKIVPHAHAAFVANGRVAP